MVAVFVGISNPLSRALANRSVIFALALRILAAGRVRKAARILAGVLHACLVILALVVIVAFTVFC